jgi:hypothetical protein
LLKGSTNKIAIVFEVKELDLYSFYKLSIITLVFKIYSFFLIALNILLL